MKPLDEIKGKRITEVILQDEIIILISFDGSDKKLQLEACADCCSESWFETLNEPFESMIGKEIKTIEIKEHIKMPTSNRQESDDNCKIAVSYTDGTMFEFVLRNSSNGYYSGYLEMRLI